MSNETYDLIGVGSPVNDYLAHVDDAFLETIEGEKGGMVLVEDEAITEMLARTLSEITQAPGGSAGNTAFTAARLGLKTAFVGKIGPDRGGEFYRRRFSELGGDTSRFLVGDRPTGRCLSLITPDSKRTMRTHLGAALTLDPHDITPALFEGARHTHIEGYLLFNYELMMAVLKSARAAGCTVSLDLASFEVVEATKSFLPELLQEYVDVVFGNEEECTRLLGAENDFPDMARTLAGWCDVAAVKLGPAGSLVASGDKVETVAPIRVHAIDTTGAGDVWASGFLYGWLNGRDLATCGRFGSILGAAIVQVDGAELPQEAWERVAAEIGAEMDEARALQS